MLHTQTHVDIEKAQIEIDDETQPLTEALEAINEDSLTQWEKERWQSVNGVDGRQGDNASPEHGDNQEDSNSKTGRSSGVGGGSRNSTTSEEGFNSPAITSTNLNVNTSDIIDDDSNSTSGVENGPKDDCNDDYYDEEDESEFSGKQNGLHNDIDCDEEEEQLLGTIKRRSLVKDFAPISENEVLIEAVDEIIRVDEDNNICSNGDGSNALVNNGIANNTYTKIQEMGNGNIMHILFLFSAAVV